MSAGNSFNAITSKARCAAAIPGADHTIDQQWSAYAADEHDRWDRLFERCWTVLETRACAQFLDAARTLRLSDGGVPDMARLSDRLEPLTGWRVVPVKGLVPDDVFFDHLANRRFPAGAFIRDESEMDYLEEPDIFHDVFGHVPLLADPAYARFMEAYGKGGQRAMALGQLHHLARLYWYTIEFGLVRSATGLKLFGAGIMSSTAESVFALESPAPNRIAFDLERVMRTAYVIDDFQQTYFVIDSFDALVDTCMADFGDVYIQLKGSADIAPNQVLESDVVLHRGQGRA